MSKKVLNNMMNSFIDVFLNVPFMFETLFYKTIVKLMASYINLPCNWRSRNVHQILFLLLQLFYFMYLLGSHIYQYILEQQNFNQKQNTDHKANIKYSVTMSLDFLKFQCSLVK